MFTRTSSTERRKAIRTRIRQRVTGTADKPRLAVWKSDRNVAAQLIDDVQGRTLVSASTLEKSTRGSIPKGGSVAAAKAVGELVAQRAIEKKIVQVVFDRGGFLYHGAIKALADAARAKGLKF